MFGTKSPSCGGGRGKTCVCSTASAPVSKKTPSVPIRDYIGEALQHPHRIFLCSFRPLSYSVAGRMAVDEHRLPPFIDASCRREPDLESKFPSISALCRKEHFAPRLRVGSKVVYIAKKGHYFRSLDTQWRLVAILEVVHSFPTHQMGSEWYQDKGLPLPSNCMVAGNPPKNLELTDRIHPNLPQWDGIYRQRAKECGVFHVCRKIYLELKHPSAITNKMMMAIFGRIPSTQTPPSISEKQYERLYRIANRPG